MPTEIHALDLYQPVSLLVEDAQGAEAGAQASADAAAVSAAAAATSEANAANSATNAATSEANAQASADAAAATLESASKTVQLASELDALPVPSTRVSIYVQHNRVAPAGGEPGDAGGSWWTWEPGSSEAANGYTVRQISGEPNGRWLRALGPLGEVPFDGVPGGTVDNRAAFTDWLQFLEDEHKLGSIPAGTFLIEFSETTRFRFEQGVEFRGAGMFNTTLLFKNTHADALTTQRDLVCYQLDGQRFFARDFTVSGEASRSTYDTVTGIPFRLGIFTNAGTRSLWENIRSLWCYCGLWFYRGWGFTLNNYHTHKNLDGIVVGTLDPDGPGDNGVNINACEFVDGNIASNFRDGFRFDARGAQAACDDNRIAVYAEGNNRGRFFTGLAHDLSIQGDFNGLTIEHVYTETSSPANGNTITIGTQAPSSIVGLTIKYLKHNQLLAIDNAEMVHFVNASHASKFGRLWFGPNVKGIYGLPPEAYNAVRVRGGNIHTSQGGIGLGNTQSTGHVQYVVDFDGLEKDTELGNAVFVYEYPEDDLTYMRHIVHGASSFKILTEPVNTNNARSALASHRAYARFIGDGSTTTGLKYEAEWSGDIARHIGDDLHFTVHWRHSRPRAFSGAVVTILYYIAGDPSRKGKSLTRTTADTEYADILTGWNASHYHLTIADLLDEVEGGDITLDGVRIRVFGVRSGDTALVSDVFDISHITVGSGVYPAAPFADAQSELARWKMNVSILNAGQLHARGRFRQDTPPYLRVDETANPGYAQFTSGEVEFYFPGDGTLAIRGKGPTGEALDINLGAAYTP